MPNWCEGNLRIRGKKEDIVKLLKDKFKYCYYDDNLKIEELECTVVVPEDKWEDIEIHAPKLPKLDSNRKGWWYLSGTKRAFVYTDNSDDTIYIQLIETRKLKEEDSIIAYVNGFRQAWGIDPENFQPWSKDYGVDLKIFGWEMGMEFSQVIEIVGGEITMNDCAEYKDWYWESTNPFFGG